MDYYDSPPSLTPSPRTSVSFSSDECESAYSILEDSSPAIYGEPHPLGPGIGELPVPIAQTKSHWPHIHQSSPSSPSFMHDLYDPMHMDDMASTNSDSPGASAHCSYPSPPAALFRHPQDWSMGGSVGLSDHDQHAPPAYYRRASYPYVRQEDSHNIHHLPGDPAALKMDNSSSVVVPTQHILPAPNAYYHAPDSRPGSSHSHVSQNGFMHPHPVMTVMHTDDAASKETQYLRRRCFNCHQTEPPSWRRSTLNPGKIVCNKCGLYERTHLRARPHRFDELRASNKARKASQQAAPYPATAPLAGGQSAKSTSPKNRNINPASFVKKEPNEYPLPHTLPRSRRGSTASSTSSGVSVSGNSDWDDSVSAYNSNSSAASSTYSSPVMVPYNIPQGSTSPSPSFDNNANVPIRLPSAPMAGMNGGSGININRAHTPVKSHTVPYYGNDRRTPIDRRYTTGNAPTFDGPAAWDSPPEQHIEKEPKAATA